MDRLQPKLIKPESTLIEKTALELAAAFYEIGRGQGLKSKYKTPQEYAKKYLTKFIPKAVDILMDMLAKDSTPKEQKDAIYDALMERSNDKDLSTSGIPVFENPLAATFVSDKVIPQSPLVINTPKKNRGRIEDLPLDSMMYKRNSYHG
jgi:hypothetical protein